MKVSKIVAREIFDSRGLPTVECELFLDDERSVRASVPSGASRGEFEAHELRDGGDRLMGMGVLKAIENIHTIISPDFEGQDLDILELDRRLLELDGTPNKDKLGANAMLAVSMALFRAQALVDDLELFQLIALMLDFETVNIPVPLFNVINGGVHANNNLLIQEFMVVPTNAQSFRGAMESSVLLYHELKSILKSKGKSVAVGDEGGFAPSFEGEQEALDCIVTAMANIYSDWDNHFAVALDVAASSFYDKKNKVYNWHGESVTSDDLIEYYTKLSEYYPLYSIEDGLAEEDWEGWAKLTGALGSTVQIVGDDLFATNIDRVAQGLQMGAANAVLIKPNQIGTISETLAVIEAAQQNELATIISHRSGETEDTFIADLAVGVSSGQIKTGGCSRGERMAKYNRLLRIEDSLTLSLLENR